MNKSVMLIASAALLVEPLFALPSLAQREPATQQRAAPTERQPADQANSRAGRLRATLSDEADARIAHIKARLHLTPDQEQNWPGLETELRDLAKHHADRLIALRAERVRENDQGSLIDYWRRGADLK